jgi:hypothetical protein
VPAGRAAGNRSDGVAGRASSNVDQDAGELSAKAGAVNAAHYQQMLPPNGADD